MKTRQGFVSNSSSASFIVAEEKLTTTARVALMMLSVVMEEYEQEGWDVEDEMEEAIEFLSENTDYDKPICFPWGINYETFIIRVEEGIHVDTCNNHPWWDYFNCVDAEREYSLHDDPNTYLELHSMKQVDRDYYYNQIVSRLSLKGIPHEGA